MANAAAFRRNLRLRVDRAIGPAARSAALAKLATDALHDAIDSGRASPVYTRIVDGRVGAHESEVRGDGAGVILYRFSYVAEAISFALEYLRRRAPRVSGRYLRSFFLLIDGRMVDAEGFDPRVIPPGARVVIGNKAPYHRKVDTQLIGVRRLRYEVPANAMADCARELRRRFGNVLDATRVADHNFPEKYQIEKIQRRLTGHQKGRVVRKRHDRVESPALIIDPR